MSTNEYIAKLNEYKARYKGEDPLSKKRAVVEAISTIWYNYETKKHMIGTGKGIKTCNIPAKYLFDNTNDEIANTIRNMDGIFMPNTYKGYLDRLLGQVIDYINTIAE